MSIKNKEKVVEKEVKFPVNLRDYFAGQALPVTMRFVEGGNHPAAVSEQQHSARLAYSYADAMLKQRELTPCPAC